jgi:hypothetical protein
LIFLLVVAHKTCLFFQFLISDINAITLKLEGRFDSSSEFGARNLWKECFQKRERQNFLITLSNCLNRKGMQHNKDLFALIIVNRLDKCTCVGLIMPVVWVFTWLCGLVFLYLHYFINWFCELAEFLHLMKSRQGPEVLVY